ncbi:MAG: hypothetical protein ACLGPL_08115, partial [Acidobacteriota bacterium]
FRGIRWGTDIHGISGMTPVGEDGDLKFYQKEKESPAFEGVNTSRIVYGFYRGSLYAVFVYFESPQAFGTLRESLVKRYGESRQPDPNVKKVFWDGKTVNMLLTYDDASNAGRLAYFFIPIQNELDVKQ